MYAAVQSWIGPNPEYEYRFMDDADCDAFVKEHGDDAFQRAYGALNVAAGRADMLRYLLIYVHGAQHAGCWCRE